MILAREALVRALCEQGYDSLLYRLCEYAYSTGADLVDFDALLEDVRLGKAQEPPPIVVPDLDKSQKAWQSALFGL